MKRVPRIVLDRGKDFDVYVINVTDSYHRLSGETQLGVAEEVDELQPVEADGPLIRQATATAAAAPL